MKEHIYLQVLHDNSFANKQPILAKQWHPSKNGELTPEMFPVKSNTRVWWMCEKGHEWQAKVSNRVHGRNCPICSNKKIVSKKNDLLTQYPAATLATLIADSISLPSSNLYIRRLMKISPKSHRNLIEKMKNALYLRR